MKSAILSTIVLALVPLLTLFGFYLFLRGHNAPGGGFIAGLVGSVATTLRAMATGTHATKRVLGSRLRQSIFLGLTLIVVSLLIGPTMGQAWLKHFHWQTSGDGWTFSTTLIFDLGVAAVVIGVVSNVLSSFVGAKR